MIRISSSWLTCRVWALSRRRRRLALARRARGVRLFFVCTKEVTESETERNFEIPPVLSTCITERQILLMDRFGSMKMDIGSRRNGRDFFKMRYWRVYRATRNIVPGTRMQFWATLLANVFVVFILP